MWQLQERYEAWLHRVLQGLDWDDGSVQQIALSATGEYLSRRFDPVLWRDVLSLASRPAGSLERGIDVESMATAMGMSDAGKARAPKLVADDAAWRAEIVLRGRERLEVDR